MLNIPKNVNSKTVYRGFRLSKVDEPTIPGVNIEWNVLDSEGKKIGIMYRLGNTSNIEHIVHSVDEEGEIDCRVTHNGTTMKWTFPQFVDKYLKQIKEN